MSGEASSQAHLEQLTKLVFRGRFMAGGNKGKGEEKNREQRKVKGECASVVGV